MKNILLIPVLIGVTACTSLYYAPRVAHVKFYDPSIAVLQQQEIYFPVAAKGQTKIILHGWWFAATTEKVLGTVVFFHGNAENLTSHFLALSWLPRAGYNYFIFDYPGYGESQGQPTPESTVESGIAALKWVHDNKDSSPLFVYAHSLGGAIGHRAVIDAKATVPVASLVLDGTFLSYRSMARRKAQQSWALWLLQPFAWLLMSDSASAKDLLEQRPPIPLLVIHGEKDPVIPIDQGQSLFDKSLEPKQLWLVSEETHGDLFFIEKGAYRKKLLEYWAHLKN
jgi:alpha-beta hydrolase superfamily lysophospholipase